MEAENNRGDMGFPNALGEKDEQKTPLENKRPDPPIDRPVYSTENKGDASEVAEGGTNYGVFLVAIIFIVAIGITYLNQTGIIKIPSLSTPATSSRLSDAQNGLKIETLRSIGLLKELEIKYAGNPEKLEKITKLKLDANAVLILLGD